MQPETNAHRANAETFGFIETERDGTLLAHNWCPKQSRR